MSYKTSGGDLGLVVFYSIDCTEVSLILSSGLVVNTKITEKSIKLLCRTVPCFPFGWGRYVWHCIK